LFTYSVIRSLIKICNSPLVGQIFNITSFMM
jgi:hypothetical protein